jgi:hypothetical protein
MRRHNIKRRKPKKGTRLLLLFQAMDPATSPPCSFGGASYCYLSDFWYSSSCQGWLSLLSLVYNLLNLLLLLALCIVYWKKNFLVLLLLPMVPLSLSEGGGGEID